MNQNDLVSYVQNITGLLGKEHENFVLESMNLTISDLFDRGDLSFRNEISNFTTISGTTSYTLRADADKVSSAWYVKDGQTVRLKERTTSQLKDMFDWRKRNQSNMEMRWYSLSRRQDGSLLKMEIYYTPLVAKRISYEYQKLYQADLGLVQLPENWHKAVVAGTIAATKKGVPDGDPTYETAIAKRINSDKRSLFRISRRQSAGYGINRVR